MKPKHLWNRRARDICIQDAGMAAHAAQQHCKCSRDEAFPDSSLSADNADYTPDFAFGVRLFKKIGRALFARGTVLPAGRTILSTAFFAHIDSLPAG